MTDAPAAPDTIDTVLRSDHAAIGHVLAELRETGSPHLFEQLCADVVRHFVAEEQYLLPSVRLHVADGRARSEAAFAEHQRVERLLRALEHEDIRGERISRHLDEVEQALAEHVRVQEEELLPALTAALDADSLAELGEDVLGAEQLAPTHPRVFVPRSATVNKVASWLTGLVEKSLDAGEGGQD